MQLREQPYERIFFVCCNEREAGEDACANRGAVELQKALKAYTKDHAISDRCRISRAMCFGLCSEGPNLCIMPENLWLKGVKAEDLPAIIEKYLKPLERSSP